MFVPLMACFTCFLKWDLHSHFALGPIGQIEIIESVLWIRKKYIDCKVDSLGRKFHILPLLQNWILHIWVSRPHSASLIFQAHHHYKLNSTLNISSSKSSTMKHWYFCFQATGVKEIHMVSELGSWQMF